MRFGEGHSANPGAPYLGIWCDVVEVKTRASHLHHCNESKILTTVDNALTDRRACQGPTAAPRSAAISPAAATMPLRRFWTRQQDAGQPSAQADAIKREVIFPNDGLYAERKSRRALLVEWLGRTVQMGQRAPSNADARAAAEAPAAGSGKKVRSNTSFYLSAALSPREAAECRRGLVQASAAIVLLQTWMSKYT
jgi:hypothetical protein